MLKYLPNTLTVIRFFLIPFAVLALINDQYILALIIITLSGITDILDGAIARKFNFITNFGKLIDPLADKVTQLSILLTLVIKNIVPLWLLLILLIKEIAMVIGASFLYGKDLVVSSKWYGKASTVAFYIAIVLSLLIREFYSYINIKFLMYIDQPFYYIALVLAIFALIMYFRAFYIQGYLKKDSLKLNETIKKEEQK